MGTLLFVLLVSASVLPPIAWAIVAFVGAFRHSPVEPPPPTLASAGILVLRPDYGQAAFYLTIYGCFGAIGIVGIVYFGFVRFQVEALSLVWSSAQVGISIWQLIPLTYRVVLEPGSITLVYLTGSNRLQRDEIKAKWWFRHGGCYVLYPIRNDKQKIRVWTWYNDHGEIEKWLKDIPWIRKPYWIRI